MPGPPPKPTHLKVIAGNPGRKPLNDREARVRVVLPTAPAHLGRVAKVEWRRVARELHRAGLLSSIDRAALAAYCAAYQRWVEAERALTAEGLTVTTTNGNVVQNPLVGTARRASLDMVKIAAEFGMTPAARSRVAANPPDDDKADPAARYLD